MCRCGEFAFGGVFGNYVFLKRKVGLFLLLMVGVSGVRSAWVEMSVLVGLMGGEHTPFYLIWRECALE